MPESPSYAVHRGRGTSAPGRAGNTVGSVPSGGTPAAEPPTPGPRGRRARPPAPKDGARHGRSAPRQTATEAALRRRLVRLTAGPALLVAVVAAVVVAYVLRTQQEGAAVDSTLWVVLGTALLLCCAAVVGAAVLASGEARATVDRYTALRRTTARNQAELQNLLRRLEQGERPRPHQHGPLPEASGDDAFALLVREVTAAGRTAEAAVLDSVAVVRSTSTGSEEKVEVFVNLARRLQSLVHREIELLDELENEVEDPDLLKGLFHVDHLATRIRRHAENLAVLGGAVSRRQWTRPVTMTEVLRSAIAEVEQYPRVKLVPPIEGNLRGHAVADVIHLLAELIENATVFSAPQTQVLLRAQHVTAGLAVEVEDRGLGMTSEEQTRMNALLADPEHINVGELLQDGRIGLFVVSQLARRHGIVVQLQSNIYGGIQAVLILPRALLGDEQGDLTRAAGSEDRRAAVAPQPVPQQLPQHAPQHPQPVSTTSELSIPAQQREEPRVRPAPVPAAAGPVAGAELPLPQRPVERLTPANGTPMTHGANGGGHRPPTGQAQGGPPSGRQAGERPQLPRRRRQQHLVPELRDTPQPPPPAHEGPDGFDAHDPGLMAAFRRGTSLADSAEGPDPADGRGGVG